MNIKKCLKYTLSTLVALSLAGQTLAGGVGGYTGNISTSGAGISAGVGQSATATINLDFKVPNFMAIGVYSAAGAISNSVFATPATNFPAGTTFTSAEAPTVLSANEGDLNSKFDLDGAVSTTDATTIINAINAAADSTSQDIIIKGATFSSIPAATTLTIGTSVNSVTMAGGTGAAPVYVLKGVAGVPGGGAAAITATTTPNTTPLSITSARRNAAGYSRFAIVGDLSEASVDTTTSGNWTGSFTITLTGL